MLIIRFGRELFGGAIVGPARFVRLCRDETMEDDRGEVVARHAAVQWQVGDRYFTGFETGGPVRVTVERADGTSGSLGRFVRITAADGLVRVAGDAVLLAYRDLALPPLAGNRGEWKAIKLEACD